ncbi:hypothetical protein O1611_g5132 [Lasiodiplodia mahajangana]|uniref:Uncharacterized protein n=1 Tax=Lasiodiplodia mahajangana TaxID=1108764 RepID=A0ACC2JMM4_9PEZI|nr:hypothetical protein O1611_g5132 [Lasiodiplodia mahajangana]
MDPASSVPAQEAGISAPHERLEQKIINLITETNNQLSLSRLTDEREKSEWLRKIFVAKVWPEVRDNYDTMTEGLKKLLHNELNRKRISSEVSGRAKMEDSIKKSLERRETDLWEQRQQYFRGLEDIFHEMHDLAGLRIVLAYPDDIERGQNLIERMFQLEKPLAHFLPDREVGQHWRRPWFDAYETRNYRVSLRDNETRAIGQYVGVMFEIQLTTLAEDLYNKLAHDLLYKPIPGSLTHQDEMVIDLSHGLSRCFGLCVRILKGKLNTRSNIIERIKGNEDEFAEIGQILGQGSQNEVKIALDKVIENFNSGEFSDHVKSLSRRVDQVLEEMERDRTEYTSTYLKDRRDKVLRNLPTLPYRDRKDRNPKPVQGTCQWFINHEVFRQWQDDTSSSLLWVSADPGCGKSVLAKHLVDNVLPNSETRITCYFFFKDDFEDQKDVVGALRSLLHQLFNQRESLLSDEILQRFEKDETLYESFIGLWSTLTDVARSVNAGEIVCVLDALDECYEDGRSRLVGALKELYENERSRATLKFVLTTRPHLLIVRDFRTRSQRIIRLAGEGETEIREISQEINLVIGVKVKELGERLRLQGDEERLLQNELTSVPNRTYLWVYLAFDFLSKSIMINKSSIRRITRDIPKTVEAAYEKILGRSGDRDTAKKVLHIIVAATRPLTLPEMATALAMNGSIQSESHLEIEEEHRFHEMLREICGLFITVIDSQIYLLHQTCREFLIQKELANEPERPATRSFYTTQQGIGLSTSSGCEFTRKRLETAPPEGFSALMVGSLFGLDQVVSLLLEDEKPVLNSRGARYGRSTLFFAFQNIHKSLLRKFQSLGIPVKDSTRPKEKLIVNSRDTRYCTPLFYAAMNGHTNIVKTLIEHNADVETEDLSGATPLSVAADNGHTAVVELLIAKNESSNYLEKRAGPSKTPLHIITRKRQLISKTALHSAAAEGHEAIVELLLSKGALINALDEVKRTPLHLAAGCGHEAVVKLLLSKGALIDGKDFKKQTPLHLAVQYKCETIIKLLLNKGAPINAQDETSRTPLHLAAEAEHEASVGGYEAIVKLLLSKGALINAQDKKACTPLHLAAGNGHEAVVELLLSKGALINALDEVNRTPLHLAAGKGHEAVAELLLNKGALIDAQDRRGKTPLHLAATEWRSEEVVKLLLSKGALTNIKDNKKRTPRDLAAKEQRKAIVGLLQAAEASTAA